MNERFARQSPMAPRRRADRVIPLRPLSGVLRMPPSDLPPSALPQEKETFAVTLHVAQNCLQTVSMGLDLVQLTAEVEPENFELMRRNVEKAGRLLHELHEYWCPPEPHLWVANLAEMVESTMREVAREWERPGRSTRVRNLSPWETFEADWGRFEKALTHSAFCAYAMLPPEGGEVLVEASIQSLGSQRFIQLELRMQSDVPLAIEERTLFTPLISVNGHELGLRLVLAQRIAVQLGGHLRFYNISPHEACFSLYVRR